MFTGYRNSAIILTLLDTGIRLSEIVNLDLQDVALAYGSLKIFGKGGKGRVVFMGKELPTVMKKYIQKRGYKTTKTNALFVSNSGNGRQRQHSDINGK